MTHPAPFTRVTPAPGCPHYITAAAAAAGARTCPWCTERQPAVQALRSRKRTPADVKEAA